MADTITIEQAVIGFAGSASLVLIAWALARWSAARTREMAHVTTLAEVRSRVGRIEVQLERAESREEERHNLLRAIAVELATMKAMLSAHVERDRYCAAANGGIPDGGTVECISVAGQRG